MLLTEKINPMSLGANILLLVRNGTANDWASLCRALGFSEGNHTRHYMLRAALDGLREVGLVSFDPEYRNEDDKRINGPITLTDRWESLQVALDISLSKVVEAHRPGILLARPVFGQPNRFVYNTDVFVVIPFAEEYKHVYTDHIKAVVENLDMTVSRADFALGSRAIILDIWSSICFSKVVVADCTSKNPNVFYEIGIAHTLGKPIVFITQDTNDIPFDIRHIRHIRYEIHLMG